MSDSEPFSVAIVGAGLSALHLSLSLSSQSPPVQHHIYESAPEFAEIGAGVGIGPNAQRAMSLIDPRIKVGYDARACSTLIPGKEDVYFEFRMGMDGQGKAKGWKAGDLVCEGGNGGKRGREKTSERDGKPTNGAPSEKKGEPRRGMSMIHRAAFLDELTKLIPPETVSFGHRVVNITQPPSSVLLHFADPAVPPRRHSVAIACDGIKSTIRSLLFPSPSYAPRYTGKYAYRGLIPMAKALAAFSRPLNSNPSSSSSNSSTKEETLLTAQNNIGHSAHVLTMPINAGSTLNVVAFHSSPSPSPSPSPSSSASPSAPANFTWPHNNWVLPASPPQLQSDFSAWSPHVRELLNLLEKPDIWALFEHSDLPSYWKGKVALLGDAAHASTPHQGAGAGMGIEDAFVLGGLLGLVGEDTEDSKEVGRGEDGEDDGKGEGEGYKERKIEGEGDRMGAEAEMAFAAYDAVRRERTQRVVRTSRECGEVYELRGEGIGDDLEALAEDVGTRYDWIWEYDVEAGLEEGLRGRRGR